MTAPLILIGQLCNYGSDAVFTKIGMWIKKYNKQIFYGSRYLTTSLLTVDISNPNLSMCKGPHALQYISNAVLANETVEDRIKFLHACAGYHFQSTWCDAIDSGN